MKMRIPVPFQWKTYSASYRWGFSEALKSKRERKPGQIGTLMAIEAYRAGHVVARSEELPSEHTEWILSTPLKRGVVYVSTVVALVDGKEIVSPGPSSPEMKFQVLSTSSLEQLNKLKKTRSHLALGVFYARVGLLFDAEREFQQLIRLNPKSKAANKLLLSVRSLRIR